VKVLYISHHREASGWGEAARNYILALDSVGVDVAIRAIRVGNPKTDIPQRILELEEKNISNCDVVIQHVLPKYMDYNGKLYNVGLYVTENDLLYTEWPAKLNLMDELWVPNHRMKHNHGACGVDVDTYVIPHTFDYSRFSKIYPKIDLNTGGDFLFYSIIDFNKRKNLSALIRAFNTEFTPNEPVSLVIKTNIPGVPPEQCREIVIERINEIKKGLKLYDSIEKYKQEVIICGNMTDEQIMELHSTGDCFVSTSFNEAWNLGAFEAACIGNKVLANECDGHEMFLTNDQLISSVPQKTFGMFDTFSDLGTSREFWYEPEIDVLENKMRKIYNGVSQESKDLSEFSYQKVGNLMKNRLGKVLNVC